jgi:hypothetical protein
MNTQTSQPIEVWKPVVGFEGLYEVSNIGRVKSLVRKEPHIMARRPLGGLGKYLATPLASNGRTKYCLVHRLVAEAFIENKDEKPCVNHINNKADDNRAVNLEWVTYRENTEHGLREGRIGKNRLGLSCIKLDNLQISAIMALWKTKEFSQRHIAILLAVPETTINTLIRKENKKI